MKKIIILFGVLMIGYTYAKAKETPSYLLTSLSSRLYSPYDPFARIKFVTFKFKVKRPSERLSANLASYIAPSLKLLLKGNKMHADSSYLILTDGLPSSEMDVYLSSDNLGYDLGEFQAFSDGVQMIYPIVWDDTYYASAFYIDNSEDGSGEYAVFTVNGVNYDAERFQTTEFNGFLTLPITVTLHAKNN